MVAILPHDLGGLRDRAILLLAFAGGLRRSEVVGLDFGPDPTKTPPAGLNFIHRAFSSAPRSRPAGAMSPWAPAPGTLPVLCIRSRLGCNSLALLTAHSFDASSTMAS
jgi:hypothetical protein